MGMTAEGEAENALESACSSTMIVIMGSLRKDPVP